MAQTIVWGDLAGSIDQHLLTQQVAHALCLCKHSHSQALILFNIQMVKKHV